MRLLAAFFHTTTAAIIALICMGTVEPAPTFAVAAPEQPPLMVDPISTNPDSSWAIYTPEVDVEFPPPPPPPPRAVPVARYIPNANTSFIGSARAMIGVSYTTAGSTPAGFDCSGLTQWAYAQVGIHIPRTSWAQRNAGTVIPRSQAQPGDLIWTPGHIGIYTGGNMQIDSPTLGSTVSERGIWQSNPVFLRMG